MPKTRLNVFISSTSIDLPDHRAAVHDAILTLGFHPDGMERWPVKGEHPVPLCQQKVEDADIYLGIYAHRYGWRPDGYDGKSITELEYDWAGEVIRDGKPIPRLCFVMNDDHPWPKSLIELDAQTDLERFKTRVKENHVGFFTSAEDLKARVTAALAQFKSITMPDNTAKSPVYLPQIASFTFRFRTRQINELREKFFPTTIGTAPSSIVGIHGLPGVGKSALACKFANLIYDEQKCPDGVFAVEFDIDSDPKSIARKFAKELSLNKDDDDDLEPSRLMGELFSSKDVLLLLDNVPAGFPLLELLSDVMLRKRCRIIVTSTDKQVFYASEILPKDILELSPFETEESIDLLKEMSPREVDEVVARDLVEQFLENLPIAVYSLGTLLQTDHTPLKELTQQLQKKKREILSLSPKSSRPNIKAVFSRLVDTLANQEKRFFAMLGACNPVGFSFETTLAVTAYPEHEAKVYLKRLQDVALIRLDGDIFSIHSLVYEYARDLAQSISIPKRPFILNILKYLSRKPPKATARRTPPTSPRTLLEACDSNHELYFIKKLRRGERFVQEYERAALIRAIEHKLESGRCLQHNEVLLLDSVFRRTFSDRILSAASKSVKLAIDEQNEHLRSAVAALIWQANIYKEGKRLDDAERNAREALHLCEHQNWKTDENDRKILFTRALHSMGNVLTDAEKYSEAEKYLLQAYQGERNSNNKRGEDIVKGSLINLYLKMGRLAEADELLMQPSHAAEGDKKTIARNYNQHAQYHLKKKNFEQALETAQQSANLLIGNPDPKAKRILSYSLLNMGQALQGLRRYREAVEKLDECIDIRRSLDPVELMLAALNVKAEILADSADMQEHHIANISLDEAIAALEEGLTICRANSDNKQQSILLNTLGGTLSRRGKTSEAIQALAEAIELCKKTPNHQSQMIKCLVTLGNTYFYANDYEKAAYHFKNAIDQAESIGEGYQVAFTMTLLIRSYGKAGYPFADYLQEVNKILANDLIDEIGKSNTLFHSAYYALENQQDEIALEWFIKCLQINLKTGRNAKKILREIITCARSSNRQNEIADLLEKLANEASDDSLAGLAKLAYLEHRELALMVVHGSIADIVNRTSQAKFESGVIKPDTVPSVCSDQITFKDYQASYRLRVKASAGTQVTAKLIRISRTKCKVLVVIPRDEYGA